MYASIAKYYCYAFSRGIYLKPLKIWDLSDERLTMCLIPSDFSKYLSWFSNIIIITSIRYRENGGDYV